MARFGGAEAAAEALATSSRQRTGGGDAWPSSRGRPGSMPAHIGIAAADAAEVLPRPEAVVGRGRRARLQLGSPRHQRSGNSTPARPATMLGRPAVSEAWGPAADARTPLPRTPPPQEVPGQGRRRRRRGRPRPRRRTLADHDQRTIVVGAEGLDGEAFADRAPVDHLPATRPRRGCRAVVDARDQLRRTTARPGRPVLGRRTGRGRRHGCAVVRRPQAEVRGAGHRRDVSVRIHGRHVRRHDLRQRDDPGDGGLGQAGRDGADATTGPVGAIRPSKAGSSLIASFSWTPAR